VTALEEVNQQIAELERQHPDQEWRPWCDNDSLLSLEHWGLVQRRIELKRTKPTAEWTPERRAAAGERLKAARAHQQTA
jgi:hypothetical protein